MVSETEEEVSGTWTSVSSAGIPRGAAVQCGGQSAPSAGPSDSGASAVRSAKVSDGAGVSVSGGASVSSGAWVSVSSGASVSNSDSVRSTVSGGGGRSTESEISRTPGPDGRIPGLVCGVEVESERIEPVSEDGQTQHDSWPECDPRAEILQWWVPYEAGQPERTPGWVSLSKNALGSGIPSELVPKVTVATVAKDATVLYDAWCPRVLGRSHPSRRFAEPLSGVATSADVLAMKPHVSKHVPILWFLTEQRERAEGVGAVPPIASGPSQYEGLVPPQTMRDLFVDPTVSWDVRVRHDREYRQEIWRCEQGYQFRPARIVGGRDGFSYGADARKPQYRRVTWQNVDGRPVPVLPQLPDKFTDLKMTLLYEWCVKEGVHDMEIVSEAALFGIESQSSCSGGSFAWLNYNSAWTDLKYLQERRVLEQSGYQSARLTAPSKNLLFEPERQHPKGVHRVVKPDGKVKLRGVVDFGAERKRALPELSTGQGKLQRREIALVNQMQNEFCEARVRHLREQIGTPLHDEGRRSADKENEGALASVSTDGLSGFTATAQFSGARPDSIFGSGVKGTGYYSDLRPARASPPQPAIPPSPQTERRGGRRPDTVSEAAQEVETETHQSGARGAFKAVHSLRRKGASGDDSYNVRLGTERLGVFEYASYNVFLEAVDILVASRFPVDIIIQDFQAYYPQFGISALEHWLHTELVSSEGRETNFRGAFGGGHLPEKLNRMNFAINELIFIELRDAQQKFIWTPFHPDVRRAADRWTAARRAAGNSGDWFAGFGWFDDNSLAVFKFFSQKALSIQQRVWDKINLITDPEKHALNLYGHTVQEPIVGFVLDAKAREHRLPEVKRAKYASGIDAVCAKAEANSGWVPRELTDTLFGQLVHAADPYPAMWQDLLPLCSLLIRKDGMESTRVPAAARDRLRNLKVTLTTAAGRPLTSYRYQPGGDGLPVWVTYTDASRNTESFFGAAGGWFRKWGCNRIFFFCREWPPAEVAKSNITEMEMLGTDVAAYLTQAVQSAEERGNLQYLLQYGDNQSVSEHVLNSLHARSAGMRFLASRRYGTELRAKRLLSSCHVYREWNSPADALANMDIGCFMRLILRQFPAASFCRLAVPDEVFDLCTVNEYAAPFR
jgi:hypothetical protein